MKNTLSAKHCNFFFFKILWTLESFKPPWGLSCWGNRTLPSSVAYFKNISRKVFFFLLTIYVLRVTSTDFLLISIKPYLIFFIKILKIYLMWLVTKFQGYDMSSLNKLVFVLFHSVHSLTISNLLCKNRRKIWTFKLYCEWEGIGILRWAEQFGLTSLTVMYT